MNTLSTLSAAAEALNGFNEDYAELKSASIECVDKVRDVSEELADALDELSCILADLPD